MGKTIDKKRVQESNARKWIRSPLLLFLLKMLISLGLFYVLLGTSLYDQYIFQPYAETHAFFVGNLLKLFGYEITISGVHVFSPEFSIVIVRGCDVIEPSVIFITAILAFPARVKLKWKGILWGILAIHLINLIRIVSLFMVGVNYPNWFDTLHLDWWQVLFILLVVAGWFWWLSFTVPKKEIDREEHYSDIE